MANVTTGPGAKKETVFNGTSPAAGAGSVYNGAAPTPSGGTVYSGPSSGNTVYQGPGAGGTVYNPTRQAQANPATSVSNTAAVKGAGLFYLIAGFTAINTLLILVNAPLNLALGLAVARVRPDGAMGVILALDAIVIGIFAVIGVFAQKGSKAAFIIGLVLYAGDTAVLFLGGFPVLPVISIVVHGIFLFSIFKALRQLDA